MDFEGFPGLLKGMVPKLTVAANLPNEAISNRTSSIGRKNLQMDSIEEERSEIAFFDVETSIPSRTGQGFSLLEFGAILVCPKTLMIRESYSTLVRPNDLSSVASVRCNGLTRDVVASAPTFRQVADRVYDILHGRVWAGHNIVNFDWDRIREAFADIGRPAPEPKGTIDSLQLLTHRFGRRAGNMKMATLAAYFGLGKQTHRCLDDVRMNLEVLKHCATVLFLESSLDIPETVEPLQQDATMENGSALDIPEADTSPVVNEGSSGYAGFLEPDEVSVSSVRASFFPSYVGVQKIILLHKNVILQLCCSKLRVRLGVRIKYFDNAGQPLLSFVVDPSPGLCKVLNACDNLAQRLLVLSGTSFEWRPVVTRNNDNSSTIRLRIPTGDIAIYSTEIYKKDASSSNQPQRLVFSKFDATELNSLFTPGTLIDAFFSLDVYDYQQFAGIRLVAEKLIIHSK